MSKATRTYDAMLKIVFTGDSKAGKSKIVTQLVEGTFSSDFIATIGVDFNIKTVNIQGKTIKLHLWDTSGQERFQNISTAYYP